MKSAIDATKQKTADANSASDATEETRRPMPQDFSERDALSEDALGNVPMAPELVSADLKDLTAWDEPVNDTGTRAPQFHLDDETESAEILVEEGLDEADEELREADEQRELESLDPDEREDELE